MDLLKRFGSVALAVFLALGWVWTSFFRDLGWLDDRKRLQILIFVTILLILQQLYLLIPRRASRASVAARKTVAEIFLKDCLTEYCKLLQQKGVGEVKVRLSVMMPTGRYVLLEALYIYYSACSAGMVYTDSELNCPWWKGDGTCGWAWAEEKTTVFDSAREDLNSAALRLKPQQRAAAGKINSMLSVPIWHGEKVAGIFNMDSESNVDKTHFTDDNVCHLAEACAQCLAAQCFPDGVKRA